MIATAIAVALTSGAYPKPPTVKASLGSFPRDNLSAGIDWAQGYSGSSREFALSLSLQHLADGYTVTGALRLNDGRISALKGTYSPSAHHRDGLLHIESTGYRFAGRWDARGGLFRLSIASGVEELDLRQVLPPLQGDFLEGHPLLEPPHDIGSVFVPSMISTEAMYAFDASFPEVALRADRELLSKGWRKDASESSRTSSAIASYIEPGPAGRVIMIESDVDKPTDFVADDFMMMPLRKLGGIGISIRCPKQHG